VGINNEFADTRECTAIIAFYNGNRSRNVRVIANIALDLIKYRCRKEGDGQGFIRKRGYNLAGLYCALLHLRTTRSLRLLRVFHNAYNYRLQSTYISFKSLYAIALFISLLFSLSSL